MSVELPDAVMIAAGERPLLASARDSFLLRPRGSGRKKSSYVSKVAVVARCVDVGKMLYDLDLASFDFAPQFETFVSSALEMGVGPHLSGIVSVVEVPFLNNWAVIASYQRWQQSTLLWRQSDKPSFVEKKR